MPKTLKEKEIAKLKKAIKELKKKRRMKKKATFEQRMNNNQKVIINSIESRSKQPLTYDGGNRFPQVIQNHVPYSNQPFNDYHQFSSRLNALERLTPQNRQLDNPPLQQRVYHRNNQPQQAFSRDDDQAGINLENNFNDQVNPSAYAQLGGGRDDDDQTVFDMTRDDTFQSPSGDTELDEDGDEYERSTIPLKPPSEPTPQMSPDLLEQQRVPDMTVKEKRKYTKRSDEQKALDLLIKEENAKKTALKTSKTLENIQKAKDALERKQKDDLGNKSKKKVQPWDTSKKL
jgi:hypothetical protein